MGENLTMLIGPATDGAPDEGVISLRRTNDDIERAAERFEQLADELDPATTDADDTDDLRAIASASGRGPCRRSPAPGSRRGIPSTGQVVEPHSPGLGVSRQAARQRFGRSDAHVP